MFVELRSGKPAFLAGNGRITLIGRLAAADLRGADAVSAVDVYGGSGRDCAVGFAHRILCSDDEHVFIAQDSSVIGTHIVQSYRVEATY
jgi:hypothetical protein